jgi:hypothetical protein
MSFGIRSEETVNKNLLIDSCFYEIYILGKVILLGAKSGLYKFNGL